MDDVTHKLLVLCQNVYTDIMMDHTQAHAMLLYSVPPEKAQAFRAYVREMKTLAEEILERPH